MSGLSSLYSVWHCPPAVVMIMMRSIPEHPACHPDDNDDNDGDAAGDDNGNGVDDGDDDERG